MKAVGIIAEYNPCHNGHKFHISEAKKRSGCDCAVIFMSGDFVQRGAPAISDKYTRTKLALMHGADLIIELPVVYSCSSAEYFATGAISMMNSIPEITAISFGMETGDINSLQNIVNILIHEPIEYKELLQNNLKKGLSHPSARMNALCDYLCMEDTKKIISSPNNILAIEYLKAINKLSSSILPLAIHRTEDNYHNNLTGINCASATALRKCITEKDYERLNNYMNPEAAKLLKEFNAKKTPVDSDDFSNLLRYSIIMNQDNLEDYFDVTESVANTIRNVLSLGKSYSYSELCNTIKTRNLTYSRISRLLLHILLGIKKTDMDLFACNGYTGYGRVLGFNDKGRIFLKEMNKNPSFPIFSSVADINNMTSNIFRRMLSYDIRASEIYNLIIKSKYSEVIKDDYRQKPIIY